MIEQQLGADWTQIGLAVLATVAMYLTLILLVRMLGQRSLADMSSFDLGCTIALGAVVGRTALLIDPTLLVGLVVLVTLFGIQATLARLRQSRWVDRVLNRPPVLLMVGLTPLPDNLRASHVAEDELRQSLRQAGVRDLAEIRCVIMERNGSVSVIRRGESVDGWLYADVPDAALIDADHRPPES